MSEPLTTGSCVQPTVCPIDGYEETRLGLSPTPAEAGWPPLMRSLFFIVIVSLSIGCVASAPDSGNPREFFKNKTLTYIVATEPGGGYDTYGRLVSQYLGRHLGLGKVVVKNVPGGGHIVGTNEIYSARPDGLTLGTFNSGIIYAQLLRRDGLRADLARMSWVGKAGGEPRVLVLSKQSGLRSLDAARKAGRPLLLGVGGIGTEGYIDATMLARALGLRTRLVLGLASREAQLSMMRGEIDGQFASASTVRQSIANGDTYAVVRVGSGSGVDERIPDASQWVTSADGATLVELIGSAARLSRWTAGPPGIPEDRLAVLREAYAAALRDPALLDAARRLDVPIEPMNGEAVADAIARALSQPPRMVALLGSSEGSGAETARASGPSATR